MVLLIDPVPGRLAYAARRASVHPPGKPHGEFTISNPNEPDEPPRSPAARAARADLGTWPKRQADAIVAACHRQGITVERGPAADGTRLSVAAADETRANRAIADAMDDIAGAAEAPVVPIERGRERRAARVARDAGERPLVSERFRRLAPLIVVLVALMVAIQVPSGFLRTFVAVAALIGVGMFVSERGGGSGGPDRTYGGR